MIIPSQDPEEESDITEILTESHFIKILANKDYVVDIFEEIIELVDIGND